MLLSPPPKMQFFGDDGLPLAGGLVYTYEKDTTTPLATYIDSTGSVANANPIVLDAYGFASIWFQILPYTLVVHDSLGVLQSAGGPVEFSQTVSGTATIDAWSDIVVYNYPDQVAGSDGYTYRCVGTNILDDDPVGSVTGAWVNLSSIASAALTGTPTAPTAAAGTNTTQIATTAFVQGEKASPTFTGAPLAPTPATTDNTTKIATTAFVRNVLPASAAGDGYQRFPGGIMMQWGSENYPAGSSSIAITFPLAFTTVYSVVASDNVSGTVSVVSPTASGFSAASTTAGKTIWWFAIGHKALT